MLFLLRPPQTYMSYALPRDPEGTQTWNEQLQQAYSSTRRVAAPVPARDNAAPRDVIADLKDLGALHASGALTDEEFAAAKATVLSASEGG